MNKLIYQRMVKGISILVGIFGAFSIILLTFIAYEPLLNGNYSLLLFLLMGTLFGSAMIWVGYQTVTNYSVTSIKSLSVILVILVFGQLIQYVEPQLKVLRESGETELMLIAGISPLIVLIISYRVLVVVLKRLTLDVNSK